MKKPDPTETALDRLASLRNEPLSPALTQELRAFLKNRSNLVIAKAAKIAGNTRIPELSPDLVDAFNRLMKNPAKLDKGCVALTAITDALYELDYVEPEIYLTGIHHVQMEGAYGPPVDAAAKLRAASALGLARTRYPHALNEIVSLLVDEWVPARIGAVRALATNGGQTGALLLKLRILTGETHPDVLAECFSGLLANAPETSLPFIGGYADSEELEIAEAALLALGSSHLPQALDLLKEKWERTAAAPLRKTILLAIAMLRSDAAIDFLLSVLSDCTQQTAKDLITALAIFRDNETIRAKLESVLSRRNDKALMEAFRQQF
jgi:hypothetical protein